ncbi:DUF956 family protein [Ligilactobacillus equi]|uniref:DUF956 family protein n=1 Tax=Ligilactobacillus equi DSM 15833 = JCM 10991 TaxID=1423740 RepID=A0A0R1TG14_9LACO|nr:DUF956 family protein [Ligilactobacillus equi]KRL80236.1 hypothetical protein FC36_GL000072 [Ligilactobacillus equi DSM 15833 = JCM 10991]MCQ2556769.1 DUF956 family protein [Ligilactobacillus sp.]
MVQSINTKVDLVVAGTSYLGLGKYGKIMIGDKGFEFYNDRDPQDYVQIPWDEVDCVIAEVLFKGKWIPRFALRTKKNGTFSFATRNPKRTLRAVREYVGAENIVSSLSFFQVLRRNLKRRFGRKKSKAE